MNFLSFLTGRRRTLTDGRFWSNWFGASNHANETVNANTIMQLSTAYSCMRLIAETIACLPIGIHTRDVGQGSKPAPDHPLADLLTLAPNADSTAVDFWESVVSHIGLRGAAFRLIVRGADNGIVALEHLPPPPETRWVVEGTKKTCIVDTGPHKGEYQEDEIFFVRGFGDDPLCGTSVIQAGANDFGRMIALGRHASTMLANGVRPNMIMTTDQALTDEQREQVQANIVKPYVGSKNAGGVMVLEAGFEMKSVTLSPADAELLEQMVFGVEEICRWFRTPPSMIGHTQKNNSFGTGLEQQLIGYAKFTLRPYTKRIIQAVLRQLMTPADRKKFTVMMSLHELMEGDSEAQANYISKLTMAGVYATNDGRRDVNLPPVEGGDIPRMQQQMVQISTNGDDNAE